LSAWLGALLSAWQFASLFVWLCGSGAFLYSYDITGFRPFIVTEQFVLDLVTLGKGAEAVSLNL